MQLGTTHFLKTHTHQGSIFCNEWYQRYTEPYQRSFAIIFISISVYEYCMLYGYYMLYVYRTLYINCILYAICILYDICICNSYTVGFMHSVYYTFFSVKSISIILSWHRFLPDSRRPPKSAQRRESSGSASPGTVAADCEWQGDNWRRSNRWTPPWDQQGSAPSTPQSVPSTPPPMPAPQQETSLSRVRRTQGVFSRSFPYFFFLNNFDISFPSQSRVFCFCFSLYGWSCRFFFHLALFIYSFIYFIKYYRWRCWFRFGICFVLIHSVYFVVVDLFLLISFSPVSIAEQSFSSTLEFPIS